MVLPHFGHLAPSRASSPAVSEMAGMRAPSGFPSTEAAFGFAGSHPPIPAHQHAAPSGAFSFGLQQYPAFPPHASTAAASQMGGVGGFNFAEAAFAFPGPTLPPVPVQHHAAAMGFGHQQFPAFPTHAPSWVPGFGQVAQSEGPMFSKRRRVHDRIDDDA
jgi:hypothetical protein